mmetsp:Transcript_5833/g.11950  ORF Transcript_5833/g.11950 Transcript_5833/m.11950 type:complete len:426 (-) Transcript_5833:1045-2322(-)
MENQGALDDAESRRRTAQRVYDDTINKLQRIEEKIEQLEEATDEDNEQEIFDRLPEFRKRRFENVGGYYDYLIEERANRRREAEFRSETLKTATQEVQDLRAALRLITHGDKRYVEVTGWIDGSKYSTGVRQSVYYAAADTGGMYLTLVDEEPHDAHRNAIYYDGNNLNFKLFFCDEKAARQFTVLISNGRSQQVNAEVSNLEETVFPQDLRNILYDDYDTTDEPDSPGISHASSISSKTLADLSSNLAKFQSIERSDLVARGKAQICHLVDKSHVGSIEGFSDDDNNKLCLTPTLHAKFDGDRNRHGYTSPPDILIEPVIGPREGLIVTAPGLIENPGFTDDQLQERALVWLKVSFPFKEDFILFGNLLKFGSIVDPEEDLESQYWVVYTFVHVLDKDQFIKNIDWKAERTKQVWEELGFNQSN